MDDVEVSYEQKIACDGRKEEAEDDEFGGDPTDHRPDVIVEVFRMDGRQLEENIRSGQSQKCVLLLSEDGKTAAFEIDDAVVGRQQVVHLQKGQKMHQIFFRHVDAVRLELFKKGGDVSSFLEELKHICNRVNYILEKDGTMPDVTILCGVYYVKHGESFEDAYNKAAVAATYNLSSRITSDVILYSDEFMMDSEGERSLSSELGNAINEEQLQIFYQPKFDLHDDYFFGAEALVRWNHPSRGLLPPSLFIPFAEQSGRIIEVDKYVFEQVCKNMIKWKNEGKRIPKVSINLSRKTALLPNILDFYKETMEKYGVDPAWIEIELTESMAAQDAVFVSAIIRKIKGMGLDTSIDDFGTGYSSFSSLKKIPFDTLKIDKSFIDEVELDEKSRALVRCINDIGHSLGMKTIAEGVETESQMKVVKELGIDSIQGYYYARPLGEFEFQRFLGNNTFEKKKVGEAAK